MSALVYGVDPATATKVFEDSRGHAFSVARSDYATCLLTARAALSCGTTAEIAAGQSLQVQVDCSTVGPRPHLMQVRGLLPPGVAELGVGYSDRSIKRAKVVQGAVVLEAPTPKAGDPYPTTQVWVDSDGLVLHRAPFPFNGQKLCIPVPKRKAAA